jgi:hypothetical protein
MIDLSLTGKYIITSGIWHSQNYSGNFWTNQDQPFDKFVTWTRYNRFFYPTILTDYNPLSSLIVEWEDKWGSYNYYKVALPVRCIKDHEVN